MGTSDATSRGERGRLLAMLASSICVVHAVLVVVATAVMFQGRVEVVRVMGQPPAVLAGFMGAIFLAFLIAAVGLWLHHQWARWMGVALLTMTIVTIFVGSTQTPPPNPMTGEPMADPATYMTDTLLAAAPILALDLLLILGLVRKNAIGPRTARK